MKKILFVAHRFATFVEQDVKILEERNSVERFQWKGRPVWALLRSIWRHDLVYCWFATDHAAISALICRVLGKPCITVAGGVDVANDPEIRYGRGQERFFKRWLSSMALRLSTVVATVSPMTHSETGKWGKGVNRILIPLGIDINAFNPRFRVSGSPRPLILLVASASSRGSPRRVELKGIDAFVEAAVLVPEADFVHVGGLDSANLEHLRSKGGSNISFAGYIESREAMIALMRRCAVICQPSYRESFGLALAEGVSCGAVPVATHTRIGIAPYLDGLHTCRYGDSASLARAVQAAIETSETVGIRQKMHEHIANTIPIERRRTALLDLVETLCGQETNLEGPSGA